MSPFQNTPRYKARCFRIWREGRSVGWDCTLAELAQAVGLPRSTVQVICAERGWVERMLAARARTRALEDPCVMDVDLEMSRCFG